MRVFGPRFRNGARGSLKLEALRKMPVGATSSRARGDLRDALYWRIRVTIISVAYLIPEARRLAVVAYYRGVEKEKKQKITRGGKGRRDRGSELTGNRENRR